MDKIGAVGSAVSSYYGTQSSVKKNETAGKTNESGATVEISKDAIKAYEESKKAEENGAVVAKQAEEKPAKSYDIGKMSKEDRAALIDQLKADEEAQRSNLLNMVREIMGQQAGSKGIAGDDDSVWKFLASGKFTVDAKTKEEATQAISEDGFYGVKKTSQRMFDFAMALAGDDVEKMKKMQAAVTEGYEKAKDMWGKELPQICQDTLDATNKLFDEYYESKGVTA